MSVNKYNASTGVLETLASGSRIWVGSQEAHDAAKQAGTLPIDSLIAITDDEQELAQEVIEDDPRAVTSGAVYTALQGGGGGTIDPTPTEGSTNAVQSGGTYTALKNEAKTRGAMGAKNRLPHITLEKMKTMIFAFDSSSSSEQVTWTNNVCTHRELTLTFDEDTQSLTLVTNGSYSGIIAVRHFLDHLIKGEEYIVSGYDGSYPNQVFFIVMDWDPDRPIGGIGYPPQFVDGKFTYPSHGYASLELYIESNVNIPTPITIQPMIRLASDIDDTYQPFTLTNQELAQTITALGITEIECGKMTTTNSSSGTSVSFTNTHLTAPKIILLTPTDTAYNVYRIAQVISYDKNGFKCFTHNGSGLQTADVFWIAIW